ncbi:MAG TPA: hypothetical protein VGL11_07025 [Candidatus Binatia bacterium]|jgi:hypothetical protein
MKKEYWYALIAVGVLILLLWYFQSGRQSSPPSGFQAESPRSRESDRSLGSPMPSSPPARSAPGGEERGRRGGTPGRGN